MCAVTYEYNPQQVKIVSSGEGTNTFIDATTRQFITQVPMYYSPEYPIMKGINGYEFAGWDKMPSWITEDTLIKATYRSTATYDFGTKGFYYEFIFDVPPIVILKTVYITSQLSPLEAPTPANIYAYDGYAFLGWSDTQDGAVITLPVSVNGSTTYYAVYDDLTPPDTTDKFTLDIEFDNPAEPGGSLDWISKQFDSGTVVDLTENTATPDIGYEFVGFKDTNGNYITTITMDSAHTITAEFKKI